MAGRKPGGAKTGGRQKGTPNKITAELKDAILNAFTKVGGVAYLERVANADPRTFCTLLGKVLPLQVEGKVDQNQTITIVRLTDVDDTRARTARLDTEVLSETGMGGVGTRH